jgi:hypothetical protein
MFVFASWILADDHIWKNSLQVETLKSNSGRSLIFCDSDSAWVPGSGGFLFCWSCSLHSGGAGQIGNPSDRKCETLINYVTEMKFDRSRPVVFSASSPPENLWTQGSAWVLSSKPNCDFILLSFGNLLIRNESRRYKYGEGALSLRGPRKWYFRIYNLASLFTPREAVSSLLLDQCLKHFVLGLSGAVTSLICRNAQ